jgi:hypothetical protein
VKNSKTSDQCAGRHRFGSNHKSTTTAEETSKNCGGTQKEFSFTEQ